MRHKKLLMMAVFLLGLGLTGLQAQKIYVKGKNLVITEFSLSTVKNVKFSDLNLIVQKKDGNSPMFLMNRLSSVNFNPATGITHEKLEKSKLLVYPNPVIDVLNIELESATDGMATIEIFTIQGRMLTTEKINNAGSIHQIDTGFFPQGMYLCRVINGTKIETVRFSKQ